jgi:cobalamin biosynthesis Co2+ chelatase CbiK
MTEDDFLLLMAHFIKHTMNTGYKPVLLLLENQSHLSVRVLEVANEME